MPNFAKIDELKGNRMIGPIQSDRKVQAASRHPTGRKARLVRASVLFRSSRGQDRNGLRNDGAREQQRRSSDSRQLDSEVKRAILGAAIAETCVDSRDSRKDASTPFKAGEVGNFRQTQIDDRLETEPGL